MRTSNLSATTKAPPPSAAARVLCLSALLLLSCGAARAQQKTEKVELPELNVIKTVTLAPCYSCRPADEFARGYEQTALFLTEHSRRRNSPALLFNGFLRGHDYFDVSTAGVQMSVIADLGEGVELEGVTAQDFHHGIRPPNAREPKPMQFQVRAPVKLGHTYAVVLNKGDYRGLLVFAVTGYAPNERVEVRYAVKHYEVQQMVGRSPGFDWAKRSTPQ